jgi:hypothetical protein
LAALQALLPSLPPCTACQPVNDPQQTQVKPAATAATAQVYDASPNSKPLAKIASNNKQQEQRQTKDTACAPALELLHQACQLRRLPAQLAGQSMTGSNH